MQPHVETIGEAGRPPLRWLPGSCSSSAPDPASLGAQPCSEAELGAPDEGIGNIQGGKGKSAGGN